MKRRWIVIAALAGCALAWTGAQAGDAADEARLRAKLGAETARAVMDVVRAAAADSLPTRPLFGRAFEGASRGAARLRILAAVREQDQAQRTARAALGQAASPTEITAGAMAILTGVAPDSLTRLRAARGGVSLVVPLVVMSDLIARNVPVNAASATVIAAARSGLADADLLRMRERIDRELDRGAAPPGAAASQLRLMLEERARDRNTRGGPPPARDQRGER